MLTYEEISSPALAPVNLLPAGLPELLMSPEQSPAMRLLYQQNHTTGQGALAVGHLPEPLRTLMTEDRLGAALTAMGADASAPVVLAGRDATAEPVAAPATQGWPVLRAGQLADDVAELGVIDAGIAFWNPAFRDAMGCSRFASFSGLRLQPGQVLAADMLSPQVLADMVARGDTIAGDRENRRQLGSLMPSSVYGPGPKGRALFPPHAMAHGTAMSDLILATAPAAARLHGMELPQDVVRDLTGGLMSGALIGAVRAMVDQVVASRADDAPFRLVLLLAFGFLGGPQEGMAARADLVEQLSATLAQYLALGIEVDLVVPMGNHLQDQAHAKLSAGESLGWRIQPDDHSVNTVELIYPVNATHPGAGLRLTAPDGSRVRLRRRRAGLGRLLYKGQAIGAVWDQDIGGGLRRTRISLAPTVTRRSGLSPAPFGRWQIKLRRGEHAQVWVLRDEVGFDADPSAPSRRSWLEDGARPLRDPLGMPFLDDGAAAADALVLRAGSASLLATSHEPQIISVGAQWHHGAHPPQQSWYSGNALGGVAPTQWQDLAADAEAAYRPIGPFGRRAVLGNGSRQRFRAAGTSLAAALVAGRRA